MITKETVLNKMLREIQLAQTNVNDEKAMIEHVKNVQVLSELILESRTTTTTTKDNVMHQDVNEQTKLETVQPIAISKTDATSTQDDGTSIFDF